MEKYEVLTLVKKDHKFGGNDYILGRISGIAYCISGFDKNLANIGVDEGYVLRYKFTVDEYDKFINVVEELYPELCVFDYKIERP